VYPNVKAFVGETNVDLSEERFKSKLIVAADQLMQGLIPGFSLRKVGKVPGVMMIYSAGEWVIVSWEDNAL